MLHLDMQKGAEHMNVSRVKMFLVLEYALQKHQVR
jgi:hypothetical protein